MMLMIMVSKDFLVSWSKWNLKEKKIYFNLGKTRNNKKKHFQKISDFSKSGVKSNVSFLTQL